MRSSKFCDYIPHRLLIFAGESHLSFIDEIRQPDIKELFLFWLEKRGGRTIPLRKDIGPTGIKPRHLPYLFIYRREAGGRFRCILIGTEIVKVFHRDETGMYLDEIVPAHSRSSRLKLFSRCVDDARPVYYSGPALIHTRERRRVSRILLPVSSDGGAADHIFGMSLFGPILDKLPMGTAFPENEEPAVIAIASDEDLDTASG